MKTLAQLRPRAAANASPYTGGGYAPRAQHMSADVAAQSMAGWLPPLRSADAEWLHERDISIARIRDLARNEGWVQGALDRLVDMIVGCSFRLSAKPDARALGIEQEAADEFAKQIEMEWRNYALDPTFRCDAQRSQLIPGLIGVACREVLVSEALAIVRWIASPAPGWKWHTALHLVDADRLSNPFGRIDDDTIRRGVAIDGNGAPVGYHIRRRHPGDVGFRAGELAWDYFDRFDNLYGLWERPKVLHAFEHRRPDQHRGVSRLVAALANMRMLKRYSQHELTAAAANATVVGAIYTQLGSEYAAEALGSDGIASDHLDALSSERAGYYRDRRVLEDGRFIALHPTDRLEWNAQPRNMAGLPAFQTAFLQNFASSLGISYEQLSGDWSRTNYSSARAALIEVWRAVARLRSVVTSGVAQPFYVAWLQEAIEEGHIETPAGAPDFHDAPAAYARAVWIGPPRGYVDPVKEAQAAVMRIKARISTLEREAAELGGEDLEELLDQLAREEHALAARHLAMPSADTGAAASPADKREAEREADERPGDSKEQRK